MGKTVKKALSDDKTKQIVIAAVLIVLGILFCVSVAALDVISIIIGAGFIAAGAVLAISELVRKKSLATGVAGVGALLIAFGLAIILANWLGALTQLLILVLIVFGAFYIVDSLLLILWRDKKNVVGFVIEFLIGAAAFTLGMCMYFGVAEFGKYANLIFGLILILYGAYMLIIAFARKK